MVSKQRYFFLAVDKAGMHTVVGEDDFNTLKEAMEDRDKRGVPSDKIAVLCDETNFK